MKNSSKLLVSFEINTVSNPLPSRKKKSFWALTCKSNTNYALQNIPYLLVKKIQQIENIRIYTFPLEIMNRKEKLCKIDKYTVKRKLSQYESTVSSIEIKWHHITVMQQQTPVIKNSDKSLCC